MAGRDRGGGQAHVHQVKAGVCWQEMPWEHSSLHPYLTHKTGSQGSLQSARCAGGSPRIMGRRGGGPRLGLRMGLQRLAWEPCSALSLGRSPECLAGGWHVAYKAWCGSSGLNLSLPGKGWGQAGSGSLWFWGSFEHHCPCTKQRIQQGA